MESKGQIAASKGKSFWGFFRKIFGELTLLVIGILIALKINNLNSEYQQHQKIKVAYSQIEGELKESIKQSKELLDFYEKESLRMNKLLNNQNTIEDIKKDRLYLVGMRYQALSVSINGFEKLEGYSDAFSKKDLVLFKELQELYVHKKTNLEEVDNKISIHVLKVINGMSENFDWFSDLLLLDEIPDEALNYFASNKKHKNEIALYSLLAHDNHVRLLKDFKASAEKVLKNVRKAKK